MDRRVQRTRQLLRDSLMGLILERGYDPITIQDITDRANLARATFYLHFKDKDELLIMSLEETYEDLVRRTDPRRTPDPPPPGLVIFQHAAENKELYRVMIGSQASALFARRIRDYVADVTRSRITAQFAGVPLPMPVDILAYHFAGSLLAIVSWWLEHEMPYPPEHMAQWVQRLNASLLQLPPGED